MTKKEIIDGLEIYTVGRLNKDEVYITVGELQEFINEIKALEQEPCDDMVSRGVFDQVRWERDIAIEQLNELGYEFGEKIEPCGDCISRENTLKAMIEQLGIRNEDYLIPAEATLYKVVKNMPPVTPQKIGHWILTSDDDYEYCTCSECGYQNGENWMIGSQIKYCQECGCRMIEPQ